MLETNIFPSGAILGTQLYRTNTAPYYYLGHSFALGYLLANLAVTSTTWFVLSKANKRKAAIPIHEISTDAPFEGDDDPRWHFHL